ncbi:MAG: Sulphatase-modifying factor protein [Thiothrix lacustris]|uniref:Sulphatase-modifying factor protein n=1 Tax=Thiothrix lacustris TaxID=525917 RepID=A0A1Y1QIB6_9GAMM|nr:MAG: Sulphatase-modifying factor protein [Thiothrix lacustris]
MTYRNYLSPPVFPYAWASDWGEDRYGLWQAFTYKDVRHAFRWIEPGTFMMGSPETEKGRLDWEIQHQVTLNKGFWMAETPVTQALWQVVMGENPSNFKGEKRPVEQVSWNDAQAFITKLNQVHPDLNVCLPTEAQWEYACRAGTQTPFNFGDELTLDKVNYCGNWDSWGFADGAKQQTTDVASYSSNAWGLYDMHGNVWEWCQDVWQEKLPASPVTDPEGVAGGDQESGVGRVIRGGSWYDYDRVCRSAYRDGTVPDNRSYDGGFRLILGH